MRFIDEAEIVVKAGNGGDGSVSFLHTYLNPFSGPDGGEGGTGGNIYFRGTREINSLYIFSFKKKWEASHGFNGGKKLKTGKNGKNVYIEVPLGTTIYIIDDNKVKKFFCEILSEGESVIASSGGRGGLGNHSLKSSTNRSPKYRQKGFKTDEVHFYLELKVIADLGFVGFPNCGKSTLLNSLTNSKSKTGDFDFTTLTPQIGTFELVKNKDNLLIADLPGIIKDSSKNRGLGFKFLKHISRCKKIFYVIDATRKSLWKSDFETLKDEINKSSSIQSQNKELEKQEIVLVLNKVDMLTKDQIFDLKLDLTKNLLSNKFFLVSALKDEGTLSSFASFLKSSFSFKNKESDLNIKNTKTFYPAHQSYDFTRDVLDIEVRKIKKSLWVVSSFYIERFFSKVKSASLFENEISRLFDSTFVEKILRKEGVKKGDTLIINKKEYLWK